MSQEKVSILGIAPYEKLRRTILEAASGRDDLTIEVFEGDREAGVDIFSSLNQEKYDVIISRGSTADMLSDAAPMPVIPVEISGFDILHAIRLAQNYGERFAIVGFSAVMQKAHTICDLLQLNPDIRTAHSHNELRLLLKTLQTEGCQTIVGDQAAHTVAREMGFHAYLITSGRESVEEAVNQAVHQGRAYRRNVRENRFMRDILRTDTSMILALNGDGSVFFSSEKDVSEALKQACIEKMRSIPRHKSLHFYFHYENTLQAITARISEVNDQPVYVFRSQPSQIPLRPGRAGLRQMSKAECEHLFTTSFYSISGVMGELEPRINSIALSRQPVMIVGEAGTGKEQVARALYLRGSWSNSPFIELDCSLMDDKTWNFLLEHHSSPLNAQDTTIYFQHLESITPARQAELLALIRATALTTREKLIFSCTCIEGSPLPETIRQFHTQLSCLSLRLPALRNRADEISSLAMLYLSSLNKPLNKQITGLEPQAMELLRSYDWPHNYEQFKQILHELAVLSNSSYITGRAVGDLLSNERSVNRPAATADNGISIKGKTLDQITRDIVAAVLDENLGNQTAAAAQLGIGRTTLWRMLNQKKN